MGKIPVGRIVSAHGLKGEVKFRYYNASEEDFYRYTSLFAFKDGKEIELRPAHLRFRKGAFFLKFEGINTIEDTSFLMQQELFVREEDLPLLGENEYFEYQLIGLSVVNEQAKMLGRVERIIHTRGGDVLSVSGDRELLVPMVEDAILKISIADGVVQIREDLLS